MMLLERVDARLRGGALLVGVALGSIAAGQTTHLPFDMPGSSLLSDPSSPQVFAHYIPSFSVSVGNNDPSSDYWETQYLSPTGEGSKWIDQGGFVRQRPLGRAPILSNSRDHWTVADKRSEVRMAESIGINGFAVDILSYETSAAYDNWSRTLDLFQAVERESDQFKLMIMPDMSAMNKISSTYIDDNFNNIIRDLSTSSAAYRTTDGRLVVAPYLAETKSAAWYEARFQELASEGIDVAFIPLFQGWQSDVADHVNNYPGLADGVSDWGGSRTVNTGLGLANDADQAHALGLDWMAPVATQDSRPRSSQYNEATNSKSFRTWWRSAIEGGADLAQIITWNDYSEGTELMPSSQTTHAFYDLAAYYISEFKTGQAPDIQRDAMYGFYREHHTNAGLLLDSNGNPVLDSSGRPMIDPAINSPQTIAFKAVGGAPVNNVELHAFLTERTQLEIEIDGQIYATVAEAGRASLFAPFDLEMSGTPIFRLKRGGVVISEHVGWNQINNDIEVQDFLYHGSSSLRINPAENEFALSSWYDNNGHFSAATLSRWSEERSPFSRITNDLAVRYTDTAGNGGASAGVAYSFLTENSSDTLVVQLDFKILDIGANDLRTTLMLTDEDAVGGSFLRLFHQAGDGHHYLANQTNAGINVLTDAEVEAETWYRLIMEIAGVDGASDVYKLTLLDTQGVVATVDNLPFRVNLTELAGLSVFSNSNDAVTGGFLLDNVRIGSELLSLPIPEPTTSMFVVLGATGFVMRRWPRAD